MDHKKMKLAGIHTVPMNIGDFISGTMHMDTLERGAYIMLLFSHYQAGESGLPDDPKKLARIAGVSSKIWEKISPVLAEKFSVENGFWVHQKCVDTLRKVHDKSSSQRAKALKKHRPDHATAEPRQSHTKPKTNTNDISKDISPPLPPTGVQKPEDVSDEVWNDFLSHRKAKKAKVTQTAILGIRRQAEKAKWTMEQALEEICQRGWTGFNAEWVNKEKNNGTNLKQLTYSERLDRASEQALAEIYAEYDSREQSESSQPRQIAPPEPRDI